MSNHFDHNTISADIISIIYRLGTVVEGFFIDPLTGDFCPEGHDLDDQDEGGREEMADLLRDVSCENTPPTTPATTVEDKEHEDQMELDDSDNEFNGFSGSFE